jgi:GNAT superfamily N-acetyltransferase
MLLVAFDWRGTTSPIVLAGLMVRPEVAHYVEGWPRPGDSGCIAQDGAAPIGAAWWRFFTGSDPGYGYVNDSTPELSIGVARDYRGRGTGTSLLEALIGEARRRQLSALSLSVEPDNRARVLYLRQGFEVVGHAGNADTMLLRLGA